MLARVDGKSPAEYLTDEDRTVVREISRNLVSNRADEFERATLLVEASIRKRE